MPIPKPKYVPINSELYQSHIKSVIDEFRGNACIWFDNVDVEISPNEYIGGKFQGHNDIINSPLNILSSFNRKFRGKYNILKKKYLQILTLSELNPFKMPPDATIGLKKTDPSKVILYIILDGVEHEDIREFYKFIVSIFEQHAANYKRYENQAKFKIINDNLIIHYVDRIPLP